MVTKVGLIAHNSMWCRVVGFVSCLAVLSFSFAGMCDETVRQYESKMSCGVDASVTLACPAENVATPYDCTLQKISVGYTGMSGKEVVDAWLDGFALLVPVGWICHSEGGRSAIEIYFATGGNCDKCEKWVWIDTKARLLDEATAHQMFPQTWDAWRSNMVWLNDPRKVK